MEVDSLLLPAPKRKGGSWLSLEGMELVENPLARVRDGRSRMDFLRLVALLVIVRIQCEGPAYSMAVGGGASKDIESPGGDDAMVISTLGGGPGVGESMSMCTR